MSNIIYEEEDCLNYDKSDKPQMEILRLLKGETGCNSPKFHVLCFILEGTIRLTDDNSFNWVIPRGKILFLPVGEYYYYEALDFSEVIVIRLLEPVMLCNRFRTETLYSIRCEKTVGKDNTEEKGFKTMDIHPALKDFLRSIHRSLLDGVRCKRYFELNLELLFILLRCYYPGEALCDFLYGMLSKDMVFSEYIRMHWMNHRTVKELAAFMYLSPSHFTRKFTRIFGQSPYKWIMSAKMKAVYNDLVYTEKNFKQVASDNGFSSVSLFTQTVKRELGKTPIEIRTGNPISKKKNGSNPKKKA